ncbi:MAG: class D sortase [Anaerolineales bacterium]|nr:class D sortase [Anaerolineales bacterium]
MPVTKRPEDLSEQELRRLLLEKRRQARQQRLDHFRRTGRAISLVPDLPPDAAQEWRLLDPLPEAEMTGSPVPTVRQRWFDRILLMIEIVAVIGLLGVLANAFGLLQALNQEVAEALRQPTVTPTPLITAVVLPGGHTPPTSEGGAQFNEAEIPAHLRPLVQSLANLPMPTPSPQQAIRIQIPAIGVDAPIVQGDSWEQLKKGVGQHLGSGNPGQPGNVVLSAHNDIYGEIFRDLDRLRPGDIIILFTAQQQYTYQVTGSAIVEPTAVEVMAPTSYPAVTLISCYPYLVDNKRIVVFGQLKSP